MSSTAYFRAIKAAILADIQQAETEIQVAVAWFTDRELFNALLLKLQQQVTVHLLIRNDYVNNRDESLDWQQFIDAGGVLYSSLEAKPLHHKFCVIDHRVLLTGSYNWTYLAHHRNQENCIRSSDTELLQQFTQEFHHLTGSLKQETQPVRVPFTKTIDTFLKAYVTSDQEVQYQQEELQIQDLYSSMEQAEYAALHGDYEKATTIYQRVVSTHPNNDLAHYNLSLIYLRQNKPVQAIEASQAAESAGYKDSILWNTRGEAHWQLQQITQALKCFDKSIQLKPWGSEAFYNKWEMLESVGRHKEADKCKAELLIISTDGIRRPTPKQDAVDLFYHHLCRARLFSEPIKRQKAVVAAQKVYDSLPEHLKDHHFQYMINQIA